MAGPIKKVQDLNKGLKNVGKSAKDSKSQIDKFGKAISELGSDERKLKTNQEALVKQIHKLADLYGKDFKSQAQKANQEINKQSAINQKIVNSNKKLISSISSLIALQKERSREETQAINLVLKQKKKEEAQRNKEIATQKRLAAQRRRALEPLGLAIKRAKAVGISFAKGTKTQIEFTKAYRKGGITLREYIRELNKLSSAEERARKATSKLADGQRRLNSSFGLGIRNTRNGGQAFSVFRSKLLLASFGVGLFTRATVDQVKAFGRQEQAVRRVTSTIISTGRIFKTSSKEISNFASELQKTTGISDELILESSALLLTFTNVEEVFNRAQSVILDVATAMGQDLQSATIQVGKALQDPTKGLSALSRVGIQFSEIQKRQIKEFEQLGETAEAQKIILTELEVQFGALAIAMRNTATGQIEAMNAAFGDLQEKIGKQMAPAVTSLSEIFKGIFENTTQSTITNIISLASGVTLAIGSFAAFIRIQKFAIVTTKSLTTAFKLGTAAFTKFGLIAKIVRAALIPLGFILTKTALDAKESTDEISILSANADNATQLLKRLIAEGGTQEADNFIDGLDDSLTKLAKGLSDATPTAGDFFDDLSESVDRASKGLITLDTLRKRIQERTGFDLAESAPDIQAGLTSSGRAVADGAKATKETVDNLKNLFSELTRSIEAVNKYKIAYERLKNSVDGFNQLSTTEQAIIFKVTDATDKLNTKLEKTNTLRGTSEIERFNEENIKLLVSLEEQSIAQKNQILNFEDSKQAIKDVINEQAKLIVEIRKQEIISKNNLKIDTDTVNVKNKLSDTSKLLNENTLESIASTEREQQVRAKFAQLLGISVGKVDELVSANQSLFASQRKLAVKKQTLELESRNKVLEDNINATDSLLEIEKAINDIRIQGGLEENELLELRAELVRQAELSAIRGISAQSQALDSQLNALSQGIGLNTEQFQLEQLRLNLIKEFPNATKEQLDMIEMIISKQKELNTLQTVKRMSQDVSASKRSTAQDFGGLQIGFDSGLFESTLQTADELLTINGDIGLVNEDILNSSIKRLQVQAEEIENRKLVNEIAEKNVMIDSQGNVIRGQANILATQTLEVLGQENTFLNRIRANLGLIGMSEEKRSKLRMNIKEALEAERTLLAKIMSLDPNAENIDAISDRFDNLTDMINNLDNTINDFNKGLSSINFDGIIQGASQAVEVFAQMQNVFAENFNLRTQASIDASNAQLDIEIQNLKALESFQRSSTRRQQARLKALNKEQEAARRQNFEDQKSLDLANAKTSGFAAILSALSTKPWYVGAALAVVAAAKMKQNVDAIKATEFAVGGFVQGPSHARGGVPIEVEGGEYIIRREAVAMYGKSFFDNLNRMQNMGTVYQNGGYVPNNVTNQNVSSGDINITFSNNILTEDFVEGDVIPVIENAIKTNRLNLTSGGNAVRINES